MIVPSGNGSLPSWKALIATIVAQLGAPIVEVAFFVRHRDQSPVAITGGGFYTVEVIQPALGKRG
jgi:hypothetical protein